MRSAHLRYERLTPHSAPAFHELLQEAHIRRFLLDGQLMPRAWTEARASESAELFAQRGVGLWLAYEADASEPAGFCGFMATADSTTLQLLYGLRGARAGRGLGSEMAATCIATCSELTDLVALVADVDEPNIASLRILEKLGFERSGEAPGAFGKLLSLRLDSSRISVT